MGSLYVELCYVSGIFLGARDSVNKTKFPILDGLTFWCV